MDFKLRRTMNSSSALNQRSVARTERKSASKGQGVGVFTGGGAAESGGGEPPKQSYKDALASAPKRPRQSYKDVATKGRRSPSPAGFIVASGGRADASVLAAEQQAAAAFKALACSREQLNLDLSVIAGPSDVTLPLSKGKGSADGNGDHDQQPEGRGAAIADDQKGESEEDGDGMGGAGSGEGGEDQDDGKGSEGDADPGEGGEEQEEQGGFVWNKKARRAEERRRRQESIKRIQEKAAKKLEDLRRRVSEEEAAQREASALRKRRRSKDTEEQAEASEDAASGAPEAAVNAVNAPLVVPPHLQFRPRAERKAEGKATRKKEKRERKGQGAKGRALGTGAERAVDEDEPEEGAQEGGSASADEVPPGQGDESDDDAPLVGGGDGSSEGRRVRQRGNTDSPAADHSRRERRSLDRSVRKQSKAVEFERHKRKTNRREKGRESARDLVRAALHQLKRQGKGEALDANEQQLATYAANLSPAKILGAGIRIGAAASSEGSGEDSALDLLEVDQGDDDSVDELMEELGCSAEEAADALNRSCRWTASGNTSRIKAATWLRREMEDAAAQQDQRQRRDARRRADLGNRAGPPPTPSPPARASSSKHASIARGTGQKSKESKAGRNPVLSHAAGAKGSKTAGLGAFPSSSSEFSSDSSLSGGSDSESSSSDGGGAGAKRSQRQQHGFSSLDRARTVQPDRHASRYLRNLCKVLLIDEAAAKKVYEVTQAAARDRRREVSWGALLHTFYQEEVSKAKGTQDEHARSLQAGATGPPGSSPNPTFTLPDWCSGQPPQGGIHFSTLKAMLEAYEKFERQTNYQTTVTFKSMIKAELRPSFESKCKLPRTVWKNPAASDALKVEQGKPEEGGWSDLRFLAAVRRALAPVGRTTYEIAFEQLKLYHRGNDAQLVVTLSVWGEKWLGKEREAEEQGKILPVAKMKILFKSAVSSVPKFKRWLEGRNFVSSSDWFHVLSRKLHKSLSKIQEAEHDNRDSRPNPNWDNGGGRGAWRGGRGYEPRGGGEDRASGGRGGSEPPRGMSSSYRGTSSGFRRDSSDRDAQGRSPSYQFSAPPSRSNHLGGGDDWHRGEEWQQGSQGDDYQHAGWYSHQDALEDADEYGDENQGVFNGMHAQDHSGGSEPMTYSPSQGRGRGGFRGGRGGSEARSPRRPVNDPAEDTAEKLKKGVRWHDSKKADSQCRDPDCGTRQDVPFCQGCGMHGHDRPFCFKGREAQYNQTGYWDQNRPNQQPIQGLRGVRSEKGGEDQHSGRAATARGNMMDAGATSGSY